MTNHLSKNAGPCHCSLIMAPSDDPIGSVFGHARTSLARISASRFAFVALAATWLTFAASTETVAQAQSNSTVASQDRIAVMAVVNGARVSRDQLADECMIRFGESVLESLVNRQLIINEAYRHQLEVTDAQIEEEIIRIANKWGLSADRWLAMLEQQRNITPDKYREFIWTSLMLRYLANDAINITGEEVDNLLQSEIGEKIQVRLIAAASRQEADQLYAMVVANPEKFGKVAREHSIDLNSAANSGMVPPIRRHTGHPDLERVAFALQPGEISEVIEVEGQFLILRCESIVPATPITPQQEQIARQGILEHLRERKLAEAADVLFIDLQKRVEIKNVVQNPEIQTQYPGAAAIVGNVQISIEQLAEECITRHGIEVLEGEVNRILLLQEVDRRGIEIAEADIQSEIREAAESFGYVTQDGQVDIESWLAHVTSEDGVTVEVYVRDVVWPSVALKKLVEGEVQVSEEDLQYAFIANFGPRVEVLAIVVQDQRTAEKVWGLAMQNATPQFFGQLANTYSTEPASQANYGRVPPINRHGGRKALEDAAFALEVGEISGLIEIGENWIILMCIGHTDPVVTDENDPVIRQELYDDLFEKKLRLAMAQRFSQIVDAASIDNFLVGTTQTPRSERVPTSIPARGGPVPFGPAQR